MSPSVVLRPPAGLSACVIAGSAYNSVARTAPHEPEQHPPPETTPPSVILGHWMSTQASRTTPLSPRECRGGARSRIIPRPLVVGKAGWSRAEQSHARFSPALSLFAGRSLRRVSLSLHRMKCAPSLSFSPSPTLTSSGSADGKRADWVGCRALI